MPSRAYKDDVGYDLYARESVVIPRGEMVEVSTGVRLGMPKGTYCQVNTRSSYGKRGMVVHHGVIDPGYTGEITLWISNVTGSQCVIMPGDKIAQLLFHKAEYVNLEVTTKIVKTDGGTKGQGSSGV